MKKAKILIFLFFLIISQEAFAQANEAVEMADILRRDGKIYTVVFGLVIILTAMIILLLRVDKRIFRIEKQIQSEE